MAMTLEELKQEVQNVRDFYKGRRIITWSKKLRIEVAKVVEAGFHPKELSDEIGIPASTIISWKRAYRYGRSPFKEMRVVEQDGIEIEGPNGLKIRGLTLEDLKDLIEEELI